MKYIYTFIILLGFLGVTEAQQNFWKKIEENQFRSKGPRVIVPKQYAVFEIDELNFKSNLFKAPNEHSVQL